MSNDVRLNDAAPTAPRALQDPTAVVHRRSMLDMPHIAPLRDFAQKLRTEGHGMVPDFDPMDGGVDAGVLFLMEKPGPMTDDTALRGRVGSGFVSRDNADPTAEAIFRFMAEAGIHRSQSILWNSVPWWNGTRTITPDEWAAGIDRLAELMDMLPALRAVVGVGKRAERAEELVSARGLPFILSAHPSPINRARRPELWGAIPLHWADAVRYLE